MILYEHDNMNRDKNGKTLKIYDSTKQMPKGWNDRISSFMISKDNCLWSMFKDKNYKGKKYGPFVSGTYDLEDGFFDNDKISSIQSLCRDMIGPGLSDAQTVIQLDIFDKAYTLAKGIEESSGAHWKEGNTLDKVQDFVESEEDVPVIPDIGAEIDEERLAIIDIFAIILKIIGVILIAFLIYLVVKKVYQHTNKKGGEKNEE